MDTNEEFRILSRESLGDDGSMIPCAGYLVHPFRKGPLRSERPRRKGEGMSSGNEHGSWGKDAVLACASAPVLVCEVLDTVRACEQTLSTFLTPASWDGEAKDGGYFATDLLLQVIVL